MSRRVRELINSLLTELNQTELAEIMGVSVRTIYAWRHDQNEPSAASLKRLEGLAEAYDDADDALGPDDFPEAEDLGDTLVYNVAGMSPSELADFIEASGETGGARIIFAIPPSPDYPSGKTGTGWNTTYDMSRRQLEEFTSEKSSHPLYLMRIKE